MIGAAGVGWVIGWWIVGKLPWQRHVRVREAMLLAVYVGIPLLLVWPSVNAAITYALSLAAGAVGHLAWIEYVYQQIADQARKERNYV